MGSQFIAEGISTTFLLGASINPASEADEDTGRREQLQDLGFLAAMIAMSLPILQLLEQRCITPGILLVRNKTGDKLALSAAFYLLVTALPRQIMRLRDALATAAEMDAQDAAVGASADAGDDEGGGGGDGGGGTAKRTGVDEFKAGTGATKLLARAAGAKEMSQKKELSPMKNQLPREAGGYKPNSDSPKNDRNPTQDDMVVEDFDEGGV